jgi:membrane protein DedA with SNARE-associated domain
MTTFFQLLQSFIVAMKTGHLPELGYWTYLLLAFLVAIEGPVATLLGAAAASAGLMRPWLVFLCAAGGNLTADSLWYCLGYAGKLEWALRFGRKLGLRQEVLEKLEDGMHKHAAKILFMAKLTVSFMIPSLIAAGLVKVPWRRWFPALFAGEMIWTGSLMLVGYFATEALKRVQQGVEYVILALSVVFIIFIIWIGRRALRRGFSDNNDKLGEEPGK